MHVLFDISLPIFAIILIGWACGRCRLLGPGGAAALNSFVYYVAMPALFLISTSRAPVGEILDESLIAVLLGGQLLTYGLTVMLASFLFPQRLGTLSQHGMATIFANTGYMGIPLLSAAFGWLGMLPAIVATVINGVIIFPLCTAVLAWDKRRETGGGAGGLVRDVVMSVVKSPLVLSAVLGLSLSTVQIPLPAPIASFCDLLGAAAGPCALFAIGLALAGSSVRGHVAEIGWVSVMKLLLHPLLTWVLAVFLFSLSPEKTAMTVILAALPTGGMVYILSQQGGVYMERAAAIILVTTVLSLGSVSALLIWFWTG